MLCFLTLGMLICTSCLNSDDNNDKEYYSDTAVSAFSLSVVNRYIHTTSSLGTDSVYKKTLTNPVVFTIDQYQHKIYNTDSLPSDCDIKHVLANITSINSGTIVINYLANSGTDSLMYFSNTDSIDMTKAKEIRVYAQDGNNFRSYQLTINVHQVESSKIIWEQKSLTDMPIDQKKAIWEQRIAAVGLKQFIGAGRAEAYAYNINGKLMVSKDNGTSWKEEESDDNTSLLPFTNFAFTSWPFAANDSTDYQLLVGTNDLYDKACVVWRKINEFSFRSQPSKWVFLPAESNNAYYLPKMENLNLVYFNGKVLAIGNDGKIYVSRDQGLTWKTTYTYTLPHEIGTYNLIATTDENGYLWLVGKDTGEVWRGQMIE